MRLPVDLREMLADSARMFEPRLQRRGLQLTTDLNALVVPVDGDPDQLRQVFANLLQNCLQFAPRDSWVRVDGDQNDTRTRVEFHNPGGIAPDDLPWVFEPYYRADKSRSRDTGGAGIGLAIVQTIVEAHGGSVGASSDDTETCVWIELPRSAG